MSNDNDSEIDRETVADLLGCSVRTTFTYEKAGILPASRVINGRKERRWKRSQIVKLSKNFPIEKLRIYNESKKER